MKKIQAVIAQAAGSDDGWAERLAAHCHGPVDTQIPEMSNAILDAGTALWALFDDATEAANMALARAGVAKRVIVERNGAERIYRLTGPVGILREIRVALTISFVQGRRCGGASIATSQAHLFGYLEPVTIGDRTHWRAGESGPECTPEVVHDLFLSVFADDPAATLRLSTISGMDLFQVPWN